MCMHPKELDFWPNAADGKLKKEDWVKHFEGRDYRASVDAPSCMFYRYVFQNVKNLFMLFDLYKLKS